MSHWDENYRILRNTAIVILVTGVLVAFFVGVFVGAAVI